MLPGIHHGMSLLKNNNEERMGKSVFFTIALAEHHLSYAVCRLRKLEAGENFMLNNTDY